MNWLFFLGFLNLGRQVSQPLASRKYLEDMEKTLSIEKKPGRTCRPFLGDLYNTVFPN